MKSKQKALINTHADAKKSLKAQTLFSIIEREKRNGSPARFDNLFRFLCSDWKLVTQPIHLTCDGENRKHDIAVAQPNRHPSSSRRQHQPSLYNATTVRPPSTMKSILLAPKPSSNNQLSVGSQVRRNDSSSPNNNQHYRQHLNNTTTTSASDADSVDTEHYSKVFSNSKKQVIRNNNRCSVKSDVDKLKRVASDVCDGKSATSDQSRSIKAIKAQSDNNNSESDYFESHPLISDSIASADSDVKASKLINLRKKNGTTLIFQRKSSAPRQHPKANEYQELESHKKRRSLQQWPSTGLTKKADASNLSRHSWYDSDYYPRAIEEEFDEIDVSLRPRFN